MKRIITFLLLLSVLLLSVFNSGFVFADGIGANPILIYPPVRNANPLVSWTNADSLPSKCSAYLTVKVSASEFGRFSSLCVNVYDSEMNILATQCDSNVYRNRKSVDFWYNIYSELGILLAPATSYYYQYSADFNGKTYYSPIYSFRTEGKLDRHFGIDVSYHQGEIDWDTLSRYIDYAIIRCGYGPDAIEYDDEMWERNVSECERLNIPYGVYLYSYAENDTEAASEAAHVLRLLEGHTPTLPVYYDLEDEKTVGGQLDLQILSQTEIFCEAIRTAGFTPGVYASNKWWETRLTSPDYCIYEKWFASYNSAYSALASEYGFWQYTSSGLIPGVAVRVDLDYFFVGSGKHMHNCIPSVITESTCTEKGSTLYTCSCGLTYTKSIAPLGHSFALPIETVAPTKSEQGYTVYKCERCEQTEKKDYTEKLN